MKFRASQRIPCFTYNGRFSHTHAQRFHFTTFLRKVQATEARASLNRGGSSSNSSSQGNTLLLPGATVATIVMLGLLHARRLYDDQKIEDAREKGILEFQPDVKATFMRLLPLRSISRFWGTLTSVELPMWLRPSVYKGWARAFHSNLEEVALPLEEYASLREFFVRRLKEGTRPIDPDPCCLISPVDGTVLQFGELKEVGAMIEQVKGFSYSVSSLLGASSLLPMSVVDDNTNQDGGQEGSMDDTNQKSWWRVSLASPKVRDPAPAR